MQIQFHTDHNITGSERQSAYFTATITEALSRFSTHITRLEVHLADENGAKEGKDDQRCTIEARLDGMQPVVVTNHADTIDQAVKGATDKLKSALDSVLGKLKSMSKSTSQG
jgi:ribosome-associated translation inhibitor RaiA